jgi:hypothetical protein
MMAAGSAGGACHKPPSPESGRARGKRRKSADLPAGTELVHNPGMSEFRKHLESLAATPARAGLRALATSANVVIPVVVLVVLPDRPAAA